MFLKTLKTEERDKTEINFFVGLVNTSHAFTHCTLTDDSFVQLLPHILLPSLILYHPEPSNENINDGSKFVLMWKPHKKQSQRWLSVGFWCLFLLITLLSDLQRVHPLLVSLEWLLFAADTDDTSGCYLLLTPTILVASICYWYRWY